MLFEIGLAVWMILCDLDCIYGRAGIAVMKSFIVGIGGFRLIVEIADRLVDGGEDGGFFLDGLIEFEFEMWRPAHGEFGVDDFLDAEGGGLEAVDGCGLVFFGEDGDFDEGVAEIFGDINGGDGEHALDARIGQLPLKDFGDDAFEVG